MNRESQFLMLVQTAIITKYATDPGDGSAPMCRPMWSIEHMDDAFKVAGSIPPDVTAKEAAEAFIRWAFQAPKEPDDDVILKILLN
jgi:hypothetical protein